MIHTGWTKIHPVLNQESESDSLSNVLDRRRRRGSGLTFVEGIIVTEGPALSY